MRNKYVANLQEQYRNAAIAEGKYWNDPDGKQDNKTKEMRDAEDKALNHGGSADAANADANANAKAEAAKTENGAKASKNGKAASAQAGKALPKTSAVK